MSEIVMIPVDQKDRHKIVRDLDRTFLVEAGAGSGKTRSLVERMVACLLAGACTIERLAAVTFTHKAAAELRERFQTGLEKAYARADKEEERRRLGRSLRSLEQCFIGTIHSFCGGLLKERPIEIGLMPDFREIEDIEDAVFREECWQDHLSRVRWERPPELSALEEVGLAPEDLKAAFDTICEFPELRLEGGLEEPPDFGRVRADLESFLKKMRRVVPWKSQEEDQDDFQRHMKRLFIRQQNIGFGNPVVLMETIEEMTSGFKLVQKHWDNKETAKEAYADLEKFRDEVARPRLRLWWEYRHPRVIRFLQPAVRVFYEERKRRSLVNFTDMLLSASALLRENPDVREYFSKKYTHILVDEFQDTDPIQAEVLMYLTGTDMFEKEWRRIIPRPGSLFLVGDPKQSIYRFRRADIDTYNLVKARIVESGGEVLRLTSNFRSLKSLGRWNNPIFEARFSHGKSRYQAEYAPLSMVREDEEGLWSGVYKITVEAKPRNRQDLVAGEDAARLADWIRWALAGHVKLARTPDERDGGIGPEARPEDFLILFRYKKLMGIYARALEERGIPYEITGSRAFSDSRDIREIVTLARALREPENSVYTAAVLRGIFFGVSDQQLWEFKKAGGRFDFLKKWYQVPFSMEDKEEEREEFVEDPLREGEITGGDAIGNRNTLGGAGRTVFPEAKDDPYDRQADDDPSLEEFIEGNGKDDFSTSQVLGKNDRPGQHTGEWSEEAPYVAECLGVMREWWLWTRHYCPSVAMEKILSASGFLSYLASVEMGSSKAGNALKLLEHVRGREVEGKTTFTEAVRFLEELVAEHDVEEMSLTPGRTDAVRLMNLHKAKGLEAPVVFLANPVGQAKKHEPDRHVVRFEEGGAKGYFLFHKPVFFQKKTLSRPVGWEERAEEELKYGEAEEDRLMYVAATRARNLMVISSYAGNLKGRAWALLDEHLSDVRELEAPVEMPAGKRETLALEQGEAQAAAKAMIEERDSASRSSYVLETVTSLAKGGGEVPDWSEAGRGMSWGRVVHAVLEAVERGDVRVEDGRALERLAGYVLAVEERDQKEKDLLLRMVKAVTGSELWRRMRKAEQALFEVPFSIKIEGKDAGKYRMKLPGTGREEKGSLPSVPAVHSAGAQEKESKPDGRFPAGQSDLKSGPSPESSPDGKSPDQEKGKSCGGGNEKEIPVIISGTIDLIFREPEGWVIVDYKSDETGGDVDKRQQLIDYYAPQVRLYSRFWQNITKEPVKETGLYFTAVKRWVPVSQNS
jgi:ATP-dependent exoDNAse (exonuclease V) beta subunit